MQHPISAFEHEYIEETWTSQDLADIEQLCNDLGTPVLTPVYYRGKMQVKAGQYVGVYRLRGKTIQVLPKFYRSTDRNQQEHEATQNLLHLLSAAYNLPMELPLPLPLASQQTAWFEILTYLFAMRMHREWRKSACRSYQTFEIESPVLAGSWMIAEQLRRPERKVTFSIRRDMFTTDNALSRVFRYVVERLFALTQDSENRRVLGSLRSWLDEVTLPGYLSAGDAPPSLINRLNETYEPLLNLARLFLDSGSLQISHGRTSVYGFILDMNRLFESFVYSFIDQHRDYILPDSWRKSSILPQTTGACRHLASRNGQSVFLLKPDISIVENGFHRLILDSKYKLLNSVERKLGVSESDLYQMLAYVQRYQCQRIILMYPQTADLAEPIRQTFRIHGSQAIVDVATADLTKDLGVPSSVRNLVTQFRNIIREERPCSR